MEGLAAWFAAHLGKYISAKAVVFIVSLMPILECRGGLIVASLLGVNIVEAIPICVIGNFIPIPFILLFIKRIFAWMKGYRPTEKLVTKLENRAEKKSDALEKGEFLGLMLFVAGRGDHRNTYSDGDHVDRFLRPARPDRIVRTGPSGRETHWTK